MEAAVANAAYALNDWLGTVSKDVMVHGVWVLMTETELVPLSDFFNCARMETVAIDGLGLSAS